MKLACNWSRELEILLNLCDEGALRLDYFKAGAIGSYEELFAKIRERNPILLHGLGQAESAGMPDVMTLDFERINQLIDFCGSPHLGIHLSIQSSDLKGVIDTNTITKKMISNINVIKSKIRVPMLVENTPDSVRDRDVFGHYPFYNAGEISRIVNETGIGFLLDITHARVTCLNNGLNEREYISALPLELVREIHVNGLGYDKHGRVIDSHDGMTEHDFELLDWVLERTDPEIITLEYGWQMESEFCAEILLLKENIYRLLKVCG